MSGVIIEPFTSVEAAERNFSRLNEAIVALQGGSIAIENIEGYENLATKLEVEKAIAKEIEKIQYKVGDVHISESATNPAEKFGYGEWAFISQGRALVGVGETTDARGEKRSFAAGSSGGEFQHVQTEEELAPHKHKIKRKDYGVDGGSYPVNVSDGVTGPGMNYTETTGGGKPFNVTQPYYSVYIWKRTK